MANSYAALRGEYASLWGQMIVNASRTAEFASIVRKMQAGMARYKAVELATGVPAAFIAVVHIRESNGDFKTYLGNGEPLNRVTRLVPAGRGPFATWEEGAVDALTHEKLAGRKDWTIPFALFGIEGLNGFGYRNKGIRSPYLWGGTNLQQLGKYVEDGVFNPNVMDVQPGAAALLKLLIAADATLYIPANDGELPAPPPAPATPPPPPETPPVVVPPLPRLRPPVPPAPPAPEPATGLGLPRLIAYLIQLILKALI